MPRRRRTRALQAAALLALSPLLQSCLSTALFSLPEPKNRKEEIRNQVGSAVLPVVMAVELVTLPAVIPLAYAGGAVKLAAGGPGKQACEARPKAGLTKDPDR